jgi:hypothetical protein
LGQRMRTVILVCLFAGVVSCKPSSRSKTPSRAELDAEMRRVLDVGIPSTASDVDGQVMTMMTRVADVEFTCDKPTFEEFWDSAPKLAADRAGSDVSIDPATGGPDFDGSWSAGGGTQFCTVDASANASGEVRVVIRSTHE